MRARATRSLAVLALTALTLCCAAACAQAQGSAWLRLEMSAAPSTLPRAGETQLLITATNLGASEARASADAPLTLSDELPEGVTVTAAKTAIGHPPTGIEEGCSLSGRVVSCSYTGGLAPSYSYEMEIVVHTALSGASTNVPDVLSADGGEDVTLPAPLHRQLPVAHSEDEEKIAFGVQTFELLPEAGGGAGEAHAGEPATGAGSHPFQLTNVLDFNQSLETYGPGRGDSVFPSAPALLRNLSLTLPPGLVGDPSAVPQCPSTLFSTETKYGNLCPNDTVIGVADVTVLAPSLGELLTPVVPIFNLQPAAGEPARLGFVIATGANVPVFLTTAVPGGGDYAVQTNVTNAPQTVQLLSSTVAIWGWPGDPRHDASRGWSCLKPKDVEEGAEPCATTTGAGTHAFLTLPTACESQQASVSATSWSAPPFVTEQSFGPLSPSPSFPATSGCPLAFDPKLAIEPSATSASTATGLNANLEMAQLGLLEPEGRAESAIRDTTVTLPAGLEVNPSSASGLAACSLGAIGFKGRNPQSNILEFNTPAAETQRLHEGLSLSAAEQQKDEEDHTICPKASKLGTGTIETPLLSETLTGSIYLGEPAPNKEAGKNPFNSLIAFYLVAEDPKLGIQVKLAGEGEVNEQTGQITTVFDGTPQVPFHLLQLHLFGHESGAPGEEREPLSTPAFCGGGYASAAQFTGWTDVLVEPPIAPFAITSGPGGSGCPGGSLPFSPSMQAGTTPSQAGAFATFALNLQRGDGQQQLTGISVHTPTGIAGLLAKLTPCPEPAPGVEWSCGQESLIGHTQALAGVGGDPVSLPGTAYLTAGYDGAPFGVLVQTPAVAGPFNLGMVNVRSRIDVNPNDASVTITTDPGPHGDGLPTRVKGIPAQLKEVRVAVDRPEFLFNPTDCDATSVQATISGAEGGSVTSSYPFQVSGCAGLAFHPKLSASVQGHASKANGTQLTVNVTSQGLGVANIKKVDLQLPKQLPSRLSTIQKACVAAVFEANPASCDEASIIGNATIHTPVLKNPLTGPAYLVSHGNAAFPDVEFVLQGEGVKVVLDGKTDIKKGITYSRFESAPDAPFTTFQTVLPAGPHSVLTANVAEAKHYSLCKEKLAMPTTIVAQNGAVIEQSTKIALQGCGQVLGKKVKKLTLAQRLKQALAKCRTRYKHSKSRRAKCERSAHTTYTKLALTACHKSNKHSRGKRASCERTARRKYG
jgi:hypothetical protein